MVGAVNFIGRDVELAELDALVGTGRLVTVTGPGGVGKTTLVKQLAAAETTVAGSVVFADLTAVADPAGVEPVVAAAMGQPRFETINASTCSDEALVIIDNCEHVLDAAVAVISELRAVLPGAAVCATSRVPLGLRDETVMTLGPLGVPLERMVDASASAVELFHAVAHRAGGIVREEDLVHVCELSRRVDGIPLAIEIAATRTRSMSVGEILERLGDRLDMVSQGGFRRDARHRSVRDTVEWSRQLLEPGERRLFDRLGVPAGRFSAAMAQAVGGGVQMEDTLDQLDRLVGASLVVADRGVDGSTWYRQLHAVRACARDHLDASGDLESATERFVEHMVGEANALAGYARDGWRSETFAAISALLDSLLHALRWAIEYDDTPHRAFELTTVLWGHQSRTDEVLAVARRALERWPDEHEPRWADAAVTVATCLWIAGRTDEADRLIDRALPVADEAVFAAVLLRRTRGQIRREQARFDEALEWLSAASDAARERGLQALVMDAELLRAAVHAIQGDVDAALEATARLRDQPVDQTIAEVLALSIEADVLLQIDPTKAVAEAHRGIELSVQAGYPAATVGFARTAAIGLVLQGDLGSAASALRNGIEVISSSGILSQAGALLEAIALLAQRAGIDAWTDLERTAIASPSTHLLTSPARLLPRIPEASDPPLTLADAMKLSRQVLDEVVVADGRAGDTGGHSDAAPQGMQDAAAKVQNRLKRRGDHWEIEFGGHVITARHSKGIGDLARLMARPGAEIAAVDLLGVAVVASDTGEVLDASARRKYEQRIRDLQAELVEAEDNNDIGRTERVTAELDILVEQLGAAVGLGKRGRRSGGSNERARTAVTRRIRTAIGHLNELHPPLGRHLKASVRTGSYCAYRPETDLDWLIES